MEHIINLITPTVAPVVQTLDSTIHQIEIYVIYPVNSVMHLSPTTGTRLLFHSILTASAVIPGKILSTPICELILVWTRNLVAWFSRKSSSHSTVSVAEKKENKLKTPSKNYNSSLRFKNENYYEDEFKLVHQYSKRGCFLVEGFQSLARSHNDETCFHDYDIPAKTRNRMTAAMAFSCQTDADSRALTT